MDPLDPGKYVVFPDLPAHRDQTRDPLVDVGVALRRTFALVGDGDAALKDI